MLRFRACPRRNMKKVEAEAAEEAEEAVRVVAALKEAGWGGRGVENL